jgi:hypothetical protein
MSNPNNNHITAQPNRNIGLIPHSPRSLSHTNPRILIPEAPNMEQNQTTKQQESPSSSTPRNSSSTPRKTAFFVYPENIVNEGVNTCKKSILGKIITDKPIHISSIQNGLENIWGFPQGLKIQEAEGGILQFFMNRPIDQERILLGNPWIFRNAWLIVKTCDRQTEPRMVDFT